LQKYHRSQQYLPHFHIHGIIIDGNYWLLLRIHDVNLKSYLHHIHNAHSSFTQFNLFLFLFTCILLFLLFLSPHSHPGMHASLLTRSHSDLKPKTEAAYQQHYWAFGSQCCGDTKEYSLHPNPLNQSAPSAPLALALVMLHAAWGE
jgi:hypothetical protein